MKRDGIRATILWAVLTAVGVAAVLAFSMLPERLSEEANAVDDAFVLLMVLGVPVLMFVVTMLIYSAIHFRARGAPNEDGPPLQVDKWTVRGWLVVTAVLAVFVIINPGFVGLAQIRGDASDFDRTIEVDAARFFWTVTYDNGVVVRSPADELVLPAHERIRILVTASDNEVLHAFWIPAFRMKIDAVPGRVTELFVTPTKTGSFADNVNLRIQCAELCGPGHAGMAMKVRILESVEFDGWLASLAAGGG